jgi:sialate O-acetylesterase
MAQWDPALKAKGPYSLYGSMFQAIDQVGGPQKIKGLVWYQGESEAMCGLQDQYEELFLNFIDAVRRDLGRPDLPILYVQLGRVCLGGLNAPAWNKVREAQRRIAAQRPNVYFVPALDLELDDLIHLSTQAQQRLGARLAETALTHVYQQPGHATPIDLAGVEVLDAAGGRLRVRFTGVTGKLQALGRPAGFVLHSPTLPFEQTPQIYRIDFDPGDPAAVILTAWGPLKGPLTLTYGDGLDPYVNLTDANDMAVPAFGPVDLPLDK